MNLKTLLVLMAALLCVVGTASALEITLNSGWNTVSTPFDTDVLTVKYSDGISAGMYWDEATQQFIDVSSYPAETIPATSAAFVFCEGDTETIGLTESVHKPQSPGPTIALVPGINFRGPSYGNAIVGGINPNTLKINQFIHGNWYALVSPSVNGAAWVAFKGDGTYTGTTQVDEHKGYWVITNDDTAKLHRWWV